jgi:hypothetical protein
MNGGRWDEAAVLSTRATPAPCYLMAGEGERYADSGSPGAAGEAFPPAESGLLQVAGHLLLTIAWDAQPR